VSGFWTEIALRTFGAAIPLILAIWWLVRTWRKPESSKVSKALIALLCVFLVTLPLNTIGRALLGTKLAPVQTMVMRQPTPGMTGADITEEYVALVQKVIIDELNAKTPSPHVKGSGRVIEKDGVRLGVVHVESGGKTPIVTAFAILDEQLVRVTCGVPHARDVDIRATTCANAMNANLGTSID
jgi:hypothetical protein